jgi:hypothetical protein
MHHPVAFVQVVAGFDHAVANLEAALQNEGVRGREMLVGGRHVALGPAEEGRPAAALRPGPEHLQVGVVPGRDPGLFGAAHQRVEQVGVQGRNVLG